MVKLNRDDRRRGLEYANRLVALASEAPDVFTKRQTYEAVDKIRRTLGFTAAQKQALIISCLKVGCSTYQDLVQESKLLRQDVEIIIKQLNTAEPPVIVMCQMANLTGRPTTHISLTSDFCTPKN